MSADKRNILQVVDTVGNFLMETSHARRDNFGCYALKCLTDSFTIMKYHMPKGRHQNSAQ